MTHLAGHASAGFDGTPCFKRRSVALPHGTVPSLCLKVHTIELLENVFEFMSNEFGSARGVLDVNAGGDRSISLERQRGPRVRECGDGGLILAHHRHLQGRLGRQPTALTSKRRRCLPHLLHQRFQQRIDLQINGKSKFIGPHRGQACQLCRSEEQR